jgi:hypothetical protein
MLNTSEPLLLGRPNKRSIADERGRGITVKSVKAEDDQGTLPWSALAAAWSSFGVPRNAAGDVRQH